MEEVFAAAAGFEVPVPVSILLYPTVSFPFVYSFTPDVNTLKHSASGKNGGVQNATFSTFLISARRVLLSLPALLYLSVYLSCHPCMRTETETLRNSAPTELS